MRTILFGLALLLSMRAAALGIQFFDPVPETCGNSNGRVIANVFGGSPPYSYSWSNGATTADLINVPTGNYTLTVTDAMGTVASESVFVPGLNMLPFSQGGLYYPMPDGQGGEMWGGACAGQCNGRIGMPLAEFGGTPPYNIIWNASSTITSLGYSVEGAPVYGNFCLGGNVTYTYTDSYGCAGAGSFTVIGVDEVPSIEAVHGACGGGANGRVNIHCPLMIFVPPSLNIYRNGNLVAQPNYPQPLQQTIQVQGLIAGDYELRMNWYGACPTVVPFTIPALSVACGTVSGTAFLDDDQDCQPGADEVRIPYQVLNIQPVNDWVLTGSNGDFAFALPNGSYSLAHADPTTVPLCPLPQPVPFTVNNNATVIMLADSSTLPLDIATYAAGTIARPGFNTSHFIHVRNLSAKLSGAVQVVLAFDPAIDYFNATPPPTSIAGNTLTWEMPQLAAFEMQAIAVQYSVPVSTPLGTVLATSVSASSALTDNDLTNNDAVIQQVVTGSYDPNDKNARTSSGWSDQLFYIDQDEWIDYRIRFQNTGTDTAFTVVITDTLAAELDMSSFQQGTASHAFDVAFKPGRVAQWTFTNILLPDSNVNEPMSHGLVSFRIKPMLPLTPGTVIENIANIYFDFNEPVITEPSVLVAEFSTGVGERIDDQPRIMPNPGSDGFTAVREGAFSLFVLDALGREVFRSATANERLRVDTAAWPSGAYLVRVAAPGAPAITLRWMKI